MSEEMKMKLNDYIKHIHFKENAGESLDRIEKTILTKSKKITEVNKIYKKEKNVDLYYMIFKLKYELAIMIVKKYDLEKKNPIERLEEKRLKNIA